MSTLEFNELLVSYKSPLQFFALKLTADEEEAKDLLQETMLKALTYRDKLLTKSSIKGWLYTIMKNTFILLVLSLFIFSCNDRIIEKVTYDAYSPVYMSYDELRASVTSLINAALSSFHRFLTTVSS